MVLPTPVPDKGAVLTQLSVWWFEQLADLVPNHLISATDVPAEFAGRALRCRRLEMLPVECIARGYLAGLGLKEYQRTGTVSGVALPPGLVEGSKLPEPIFTPTTKAPVGEHDEFMTFDEVVEPGRGAAGRAAARAHPGRLLPRCRDRGVRAGSWSPTPSWSSASTPTARSCWPTRCSRPDSSRFWPADDWAPGRPQFSFDKQFVRDWSSGLDWDRTPPGPALPDEVVDVTRARYVEVYQRLTGLDWTAPS